MKAELSKWFEMNYLNEAKASIRAQNCEVDLSKYSGFHKENMRPPSWTFSCGELPPFVHSMNDYNPLHKLDLIPTDKSGSPSSLPYQKAIGSLT